jgi:hypothetical protein
MEMNQREDEDRTCAVAEAGEWLESSPRGRPITKLVRGTWRSVFTCLSHSDFLLPTDRRFERNFLTARDILRVMFYGYDYAKVGLVGRVTLEGSTRPGS